MKNIIKNIHPAYGAVLLLLSGQLVLGLAERKQALSINRCISHIGNNGPKLTPEDNTSGFNGDAASNAYAVRYCLSGRP